jgi:hypothetical protein
LITGAALAASVFVPAHAGAWPQQKGEALLITTLLYDRADGGFDASGDRHDQGWFRKDETALYAEYGLTERFTLVGRLAWQSLARRDGAIFDSAEGLAASEAGLRWAAWRGERAVFSIRAAALIPGDGENVSNQPLGDGGEAWDARLLVGLSLGTTGFLEAQAGWRRRGGPFLDEARLDLSAGWRPGRWSLIAQAFSVWSAEAARPGFPEFAQHKLQLSLGREWREGVEIHLGGYLTPTRPQHDRRARGLPAGLASLLVLGDGVAGLGRDIGDQVAALGLVAHADIAHAIARDHAARAGDPLIHGLGGPDDAAFAHLAGGVEAVSGPGVAAPHAVEIRPNLVPAAFIQRVAGAADRPAAAAGLEIGFGIGRTERGEHRLDVDLRLFGGRGGLFGRALAFDIGEIAGRSGGRSGVRFRRGRRRVGGLLGTAAGGEGESGERRQNETVHDACFPGCGQEFSET